MHFIAPPYKTWTDALNNVKKTKKEGGRFKKNKNQCICKEVTKKRF